MHLARLKLREFRNYARLDASFEPGFHLFLGQNAQGKTNILESIYLVATLRSFRGVGGAQMVRHTAKGYFVGAEVQGAATHEVSIYWSAAERRLSLDRARISRLTDYFGVLQAVVFCTEDLQLIKGAGRVRRRFMDLLLAQTHVQYLPTLQRFMRALRSRNALLKQRSMNLDSLHSFSLELVSAGERLIQLRRELMPKICPLARLAHRRIAGESSEDFRIEYAPSVRSDFGVELAQSASRERSMRTTVVGPHRDDLRMTFDSKPAAQYGSEGQKRSAAIALKMAQAEYLTGLRGTPPVLLIDDVMGELDVSRRGGLLPLLERVHQGRGQVFMTCTEENWPRELGARIHRWNVAQGSLNAVTSSISAG